MFFSSFFRIFFSFSNQNYKNFIRMISLIRELFWTRASIRIRLVTNNISEYWPRSVWYASTPPSIAVQSISVYLVIKATRRGSNQRNWNVFTIRHINTLRWLTFYCPTPFLLYLCVPWQMIKRENLICDKIKGKQRDRIVVISVVGRLVLINLLMKVPSLVDHFIILFFCFKIKLIVFNVGS